MSDRGNGRHKIEFRRDADGNIVGAQIDELVEEETAFAMFSEWSVMLNRIAQQYDDWASGELERKKSATVHLREIGVARSALLMSR